MFFGGQESCGNLLTAIGFSRCGSLSYCIYFAIKGSAFSLFFPLGFRGFTEAGLESEKLQWFSCFRSCGSISEHSGNHDALDELLEIDNSAESPLSHQKTFCLTPLILLGQVIGLAGRILEGHGRSWKSMETGRMLGLCDDLSARMTWGCLETSRILSFRPVPAQSLVYIRAQRSLRWKNNTNYVVYAKRYWALRRDRMDYM